MLTRRWQRAVNEFQSTAAESRVERLSVLLESEPQNAAAHFLLGCSLFDADFPARAAHSMMTAHHQESRLQAAALLTFAGLLSCGRPADSLLSVVLDAWCEFHRPDFDCTPYERRLLDVLAPDEISVAGASTLARRLLRLPIQRLRHELERALKTQDSRFPLLFSSAAAAPPVLS